MTATIKNRELRVKEGRTELTVDHLGKDLTFVHPAYGADTYANVGNAINVDGLYQPTMAETASFVHAAFNSDDIYSKEIKDKLKSNWMWAFTGNIYVPNQGVFIEDNPVIRDGIVSMDKNDLVQRLEKNDPSVRFIPFGFKTETMTPMELGKNPYFIALAGQEGAEKLAEVADKHRNKPYLYSFKSVKEPLTRVSALDSSWGVDVRGLGVVGNDHGDSSGGLAFGVRRTGEASRV